MTMTEKLPNGMYACRSCGIATTGPPVSVVLTRPQSMSPHTDTGICDGCAKRAEAVHAVVSSMTKTEAAAFGGKSKAIEALLKVADALGAVGVTDDLPRSAARMEAYEWHLSRRQLVTSWQDRLKSEGSRLANRCAVTGWAWLSAHDRETIQAALVRALRESQAVAKLPITRLAPSVGRGCAFCGLDGLDVPTRDVYRLGGADKAAAKIWRRYSRGGIGGDLCPTCAESAGTYGPQSVERATLRAAGVYTKWEQAGRPHYRFRVVAFTLTDTAPNPRPWAHMDLTASAHAVHAACDPTPEPTAAQLAARLEQLETALAAGGIE